jgi:hypothetical protein
MTYAAGVAGARGARASAVASGAGAVREVSIDVMKEEDDRTGSQPDYRLHKRQLVYWRAGRQSIPGRHVDGCLTRKCESVYR